MASSRGKAYQNAITKAKDRKQKRQALGEMLAHDSEEDVDEDNHTAGAFAEHVRVAPPIRSQKKTDRDASIEAHVVLQQFEEERIKQAASVKAAREAEIGAISSNSREEAGKNLRPVNPRVDQFGHREKVGEDRNQPRSDTNKVAACNDSLAVIPCSAPQTTQKGEVLDPPAKFRTFLYARRMAPSPLQQQESEMARKHFAEVAAHLVRGGHINPIIPISRQDDIIVCFRNALNLRYPKYREEDPAVLKAWLGKWLGSQRKQAKPDRKVKKNGVHVICEPKHQEALDEYKMKTATRNKGTAVARLTSGLESKGCSAEPAPVCSDPTPQDTAVSVLHSKRAPLSKEDCANIKFGDQVILARRGLQDDGKDQETYDSMLTDGVVR